MLLGGASLQAFPEKHQDALLRKIGSLRVLQLYSTPCRMDYYCCELYNLESISFSRDTPPIMSA